MGYFLSERDQQHPDNKKTSVEGFDGPAKSRRCTDCLCLVSSSCDSHFFPAHRHVWPLTHSRLCSSSWWAVGLCLLPWGSPSRASSTRPIWNRATLTGAVLLPVLKVGVERNLIGKSILSVCTD